MKEAFAAALAAIVVQLLNIWFNRKKTNADTLLAELKCMHEVFELQKKTIEELTGEVQKLQKAVKTLSAQNSQLRDALKKLQKTETNEG